MFGCLPLDGPRREWRHVFEVRCHPRAHWEIRRVCLDMLRILQRESPIVFGDELPDGLEHVFIAGKVMKWQGALVGVDLNRLRLYARRRHRT